MKPFNSDIVSPDHEKKALVKQKWLLESDFLSVFAVLKMNGHKEGVTPTKMNTWDKSTNSANRIDLSAV